MKIGVVWLICMVTPTFGADDEWNYSDGPLGPLQWPRLFPEQCAEDSQSPVALDRYDAEGDRALTAFVFRGYDRRERDLTLFNNDGHTAEVEVEELDATISGGGLRGTFQAAQFHFHWGSVGTQGSEHTLDGRRFPMEMHIVHYAKRFGTLERAVEKRNGIAVLGFFFEWSPKDNPYLEPIVSELENIRAPGATTRIEEALSLGGLLPSHVRDYYRYSGSLTTPRCNEVVIWTVFKDTIKISPRQIEAFRNLEADTGGRLVDNFRPLQRLNGRIVTVTGKVPSASPKLIQLTLLGSWLPLTVASLIVYS